MASSTDSFCTNPGNGKCPLLAAMKLDEDRDLVLDGPISVTTTSEGPELLLEMLEMRWWREDY